MVKQKLTEIRKIRLEKVKKLRELGIDPYPSRVDGGPKSIKEGLESLGKTAEVAGRLVGWRSHGNVIFADLKNESGAIQLWFQKNLLKDGYQILKYLDLGDFLYAKGKVTKTSAGEISVNVARFQLLTKSIRPLPSKWYGLKDEEERYRKRYLDLQINEDLKDLFRKKAVFWQSMRQFLIDKGFLEVETPVLENTAGGADANPFVTRHDALGIDLYLRISMGELWQKRLMVAGFEKTFEIGRQFRNEGISREHLQDYSQMEFYWAYANYKDSMALVEEMYKYVAKETFGKQKFTIGKFEIDLSAKWGRIDYTSIVKDKINLDISTASIEQIKDKLRELNTDFSVNEKKGRLIDLLWKKVRKDIAGPAFLVGHPVEVSPLAKRMRDNPKFVERYQVIIAGSEMGNGYSELNDPVDQKKRFEKQQKMRDEGDTEAQMHDADFVEALEYGMPPVTGFGVSERLFSFLADKPIRETVLFPLLKPKSTKLDKKPENKPTKNGKLNSLGAISSDLKMKFPGISFAFTIIENVEIKKEDRELEKLKKETIKKRKNLTLEQIKEIGPIEVYREMLKKTGIKINSRRPSPEALLRRIMQGKGLYTINTAVDAYNLAVIETGVGLGGFDYEKIIPPVTLRFSKEDEEMLLLGDDEIAKTKEGEIVYADKEKLLTLDLNYRDIDETKISLNTKSIILFADGGPGIDPQDTKKALELGANYIQQFCRGAVREITLVQ